jgi:hypothetical protein
MSDVLDDIWFSIEDLKARGIRLQLADAVRVDEKARLSVWPDDRPQQSPLAQE